jgi:hypothetical protein
MEYTVYALTLHLDAEPSRAVGIAEVNCLRDGELIFELESDESCFDGVSKNDTVVNTSGSNLLQYCCNRSCNRETEGEVSGYSLHLCSSSDVEVT